jgi:hypothetical protein
VGVEDDAPLPFAYGLQKHVKKEAGFPRARHAYHGGVGLAGDERQRHRPAIGIDPEDEAGPVWRH